MSSMAQVVESLQAARDAAFRQSWRQAYDAYAGLDPDELSAEDLERYGEAAWWTGRLVQAIDFRQQAYRGYAADGQKRDAARVALRLSWDESGRGAFAVSHGWFASAQRLLEDEPEAIEHGYLALVRAITALFAEGTSRPRSPTSTVPSSSAGVSATVTRRCSPSSGRDARS